MTSVEEEERAKRRATAAVEYERRMEASLREMWSDDLRACAAGYCGTEDFTAEDCATFGAKVADLLLPIRRERLRRWYDEDRRKET